MDDPALASLSLTHVQYDPNDPLSHASAWLALVPQGLIVMYITLIWATREAEIVLMMAGQLACEGLNFVLKRYFKEQRPKQIFGKGYGMPSSHAQFMAFFSVSLTLFLLVRHKPTVTSSHAPSTALQRSLVALAILINAGAVAASRVYLNYHTPKQVLVGLSIGAIFAVVYFLFTTLLRQSGLLDWVLNTHLARMLRARDLITTEDLPDAGWAKWEDRRAIRLARQKGTSKKRQ